jgi:ApbE superfamily uncharacterized protein (UPF0280 family)
MHIIARETDLQIMTNKPVPKEFIEERIRNYRWDIENYISRDRKFLVALKPIAVELTAAPIIRAMAESAAVANVGPMATVAGAIAEYIGKDLLKAGFKDVIVENGGDIFLKSRKARCIGIYAGKSRLWNALKIKIKAKDTPIGVCTSSGTIGHSLSFGCADSVIIVSKNTAAADAVATAAGNLVHSKKDMQRAIDFARSIKGVLGAAVILKNNMISWGKVEFAK